jgi:hypothetical protein
LEQQQQQIEREVLRKGGSFGSAEGADGAEKQSNLIISR